MTALLSGGRKQQSVENSLKGEGASDACLNIRGQGEEIKQEFKEALSGKRVRVKEEASVHNLLKKDL